MSGGSKEIQFNAIFSTVDICWSLTGYQSTCLTAFDLYPKASYLSNIYLLTNLAIKVTISYLR